MRMLTTRLMLLAAVLLASESAAQVVSIGPAPSVATLREHWHTVGANGILSRLGTSYGGVGDVNNDGYDDFIVSSDMPPLWQLYLGAPDGARLDERWSLSGGEYLDAFAPIVGDPLGDGSQYLVIQRWDSLQRQLQFLKITERGIALDPDFIWNGGRTDTFDFNQRAQQVAFGDIDADGTDDFLIFTTRSDWCCYTRIMIYRGGPRFTLEYPTTELFIPTGHHAGRWGGCGDIDGDGYTDILSSDLYPQGVVLHIYFGNGSMPDLTRLPDRSPVVQFIDYDLVDCDGDGTRDILGNDGLVYRSGGGKSARTRLFTPEDADVRPAAALAPSVYLGPLNDRQRRFDMVGYYNGNPATGVHLTGFAGGVDGPDTLYELTHDTPPDGSIPVSTFSRLSAPVGDVNGDGWCDLITANPRYRGGQGILSIFLGGSYIPSQIAPDTTVIPRDTLPIAQDTSGVRVTPNPALDEIRLTWGADVAAVPDRVEIYRLNGERVATDRVTAGVHSMMVDCSSLASALYLLRVFSGTTLIGDWPIVVE